ncbi:heat-inducible transcriptional repressor HrcA [Persicimonas caeni]|uniref:heat-inducible transcriptional repressor HrcA n=1 Tax=Persicimonas caeni TaxID=2292766 RepID=UPI00143D5D6E|nr:heat-inducible transcriptional repressor HrcA [Persicimonas caeni]
MVSLTERQRKVLFRVIDEFIATGEPVSSASVARSKVVDVSSATIRNVMADLEEFGLLLQPHTSAGRIPTPAGTRRYVNYLYAQNEHLQNPYRHELDREFCGLGDNVERVTKRAGELISRLSSLTSIVSMASLQNVRLRDIKLSLLGDSRVLVILVAEDGRVYNRVVRMGEAIGTDLLAKTQKYLTDLVGGQTLAQVRRRVADERRLAEARYRDYVEKALEIGRKALEETPELDVHVEGTLNILDHREFSDDVDRLRELLRALEEKERVVQLIDKVCENRRPQAFIGPELGWDLGDDLSLIVCDYYRGDEHMGIIGVLGPIRMDYARVIPLVDYAADVLSRELAIDD